MGRLKKVGKVIGLIAVTILLVGAVVHTGLNYSAGKALDRELRALKGSGAPLTPTEVAPPPVPDEENAALLYRKAFALMLERWSKEEEEADMALSSFSQKPTDWPEENIPAIRSFLKKNEDSLNLVRQATRREKCRFPLEYEQGANTTFRHLASMKGLVRLLAFEAGIQSREGKTDKSLKNIQVGLRMGKSLLPEPTFISQLVRIAINHITLNALESILDQNEAQPSTYEDLIKELDALEGHTAFARSLEGERARTGIWLFDTIRQEPSAVTECLAVEWSGRLYGSYLLRPILKMDEVYYLRRMGRLIALSRLPYYQAITGVRDLGKELENIPRYCLITRELLDSLGKVSIAQARSEAKIRAAKLALALKIYKAKEGIYPQSLKALTPGILPQLPEDPFTGKDYIYRREGEGFLIYSVGPNLKDDYGISAPNPREEGDVPWRCEK